MYIEKLFITLEIINPGKEYKMPAQPRDPKNEATKIAWKILGKPQNFIPQGGKKQEELERRLAYEDTRLVR